jgi:hypothetical protein
MKTSNAGRSIHKARAVALSARADELSARATAVTVPLYRVRRNKPPEAFATGVLLTMEGVKFLLTAGHVFNASAGERFAAGLGGSVLILAGRPMRFRTPGSRESGKDHFDLGILELASNEWDAIPSADFLSIDELAGRVPHPLTGSFAIIGYPVTKQPPVLGTRVTAQAFRLAAKGSPKEAYETLGYDAGVNLLLGFDKRKVWGGDRLETAPDPIGMSGGGVWSFGGKLAAATTSPLLTGIATEWRNQTQHKVLVSTRIDQILRVIGDKYKKLRHRIVMKLREAE